jgi:hypothetical protein
MTTREHRTGSVGEPKTLDIAVFGTAENELAGGIETA